MSDATDDPTSDGGTDDPRSDGGTGDPLPDGGTGDPDGVAADVDPEELLGRLGFDEADSVLTRRQAEVLALREQGLSQAAIADLLGTSRANVSGVEGSARENVRKARETVAFAAALDAPVQVAVDPGTDLYDVPQRVYAACDEAGVKVNHTAPELMKLISDEADEAVRGREVKTEILVGVSVDGEVNVRRRV